MLLKLEALFIWESGSKSFAPGLPYQLKNLRHTGISNKLHRLLWEGLRKKKKRMLYLRGNIKVLNITLLELPLAT